MRYGVLGTSLLKEYLIQRYIITALNHDYIAHVQAIRLIDSGKRLSPPLGCPKMIYELMILCW